MNAHDLKHLLGNLDLASDDRGSATGRIKAALHLAETRLKDSEKLLVSEALRDIESCRFREKLVRDRMQSELDAMDRAAMVKPRVDTATLRAFVAWCMGSAWPGGDKPSVEELAKDLLEARESASAVVK